MTNLPQAPRVNSKKHRGFQARAVEAQEQELFHLREFTKIFLSQDTLNSLWALSHSVLQLVKEENVSLFEQTVQTVLHSVIEQDVIEAYDSNKSANQLRHKINVCLEWLNSWKEETGIVYRLTWDSDPKFYGSLSAGCNFRVIEEVSV